MVFTESQPVYTAYPFRLTLRLPPPQIHLSIILRAPVIAGYPDNNSSQ